MLLLAVTSSDVLLELVERTELAVLPEDGVAVRRGVTYPEEESGCPMAYGLETKSMSLMWSRTYSTYA